MRALVSHGVFEETKEDYFANNHISQALVGNPALRANIQLK
jgi:hypothetical protein